MSMSICLGQMFPGMEILVYVAWLVAAAMGIGIVVGPILLFRWGLARNFGFTVRHDADGKARVSISLRNLLLWATLAPMALGLGWRLWHWRTPELEAEKRILAVGGEVHRWNDAIWPLEYDEVLHVDLARSTAGREEAGLLARFPTLDDVRIGERQLDAEILQAMPNLHWLTVEDASIETKQAQLLAYGNRFRYLRLHNCQVTEEAESILASRFGERFRNE